VPRRALSLSLLAAVMVGGILLAAGKAFEDRPAARTQRGEATRTPGRPPVVMVIFDEFPIDALLGPDGRIDRLRYPGFAALGDISTWFPNASTIYDSTPKAVPAILDGRLPFKGQRADTSDHPNSVYTLLGRRGYRIVDSEEATSLCPRRYCRRGRSRRPAIIPHLNRGRLERLEHWIGSIRPGRRPTFWLKHALLPHGPWLYLPSGQQMRPGVSDPVRGMGGPRGFHDRWLTLHNEQRWLLQVGFTDREIQRLLERLRATGMLDDALIVVTADHGYAWELGVRDRRRVSESNVDEIAPVPLFIKAPGQRRGRIDRTYARTIDIVPTIADVLGFRLPWRADGRSAFGRKLRRRRVVRLPTRSFDRIIKVSARALERRRRANVRRRLRRFGFGLTSAMMGGSPRAELYWIAPRRGLIGRSLGELRPGGPGRTRARIAGAGLTRAVVFSSRLLPIQVGGRITGGRGRRRDIAVAVNGTVAAVGRSFYLRGSRTEGFSVLLPETSLREGSNDVRVYEVSGGRGPARLAFLGSN
jgi:hypothetical protein